VEHVTTDKAPAAIGPYSQATIANGFLFSAGQIAIDPATGQVIDGDIDAQAERPCRSRPCPAAC
jgi:2-iminobutanoate/2-iminopropanoate deaminase